MKKALKILSNKYVIATLVFLVVIVFLDENNMPGIGKWLTRKKLGISMGYNACSGFCSYPLYTLFI